MFRHVQLTALAYRNKQEFVDDLYLIISNCKLYNGTDISNTYVRYVASKFHGCAPSTAC